MLSKYDVVVIGGGPAGIQAAIYTQRAGFSTLLISAGKTELSKAHNIENYFGFSEPITGKSLQQAGIEQAQRLGIEILAEQVTGAGFSLSGTSYELHTANTKVEAEALIVATGMAKQASKIKGAQELLGNGVSYCATCDGFFYRGKKVGIVGGAEFALSEAKELEPLASEVIVFLNGKEPSADFQSAGFTVYPGKIKELKDSSGYLDSVILDSDESVQLAGLFFAEGQAGAVSLALKLGLETVGNAIKVDENMKTNMPGIYACGDCTGKRPQVAVAVGQGAIAGMEASDYLRSKRNQKKQERQWG